MGLEGGIVCEGWQQPERCSQDFRREGWTEPPELPGQIGASEFMERQLLLGLFPG